MKFSRIFTRNPKYCPDKISFFDHWGALHPPIPPEVSPLVFNIICSTADSLLRQLLVQYSLVQCENTCNVLTKATNAVGFIDTLTFICVVYSRFSDQIHCLQLSFTNCSQRNMNSKHCNHRGGFQMKVMSHILKTLSIMFLLYSL